MNWLTRLFVLCSICVLTNHTQGTKLHSQEWPGFRGQDGSGNLETDGVLSRSRKIGLKIRWKKRIGSGYSSVVVSQGRVVAMYCNQSQDLIGCFSQENGEEIWTVPIGDRFKGENGSFDGPISTPLVRDGMVFCLSPRGKMFSLKLSDGSELWSRDLVEQDEAKKPLYGFATTPILVDETLVVQTGGEEKSLTGLDATTGQAKWACSSDSIDSQSPALITIEGKQIVLAAGGKNLTGVDPDNGNVLFEHPHGGGNGSAMVPVVFDGNKVLMTLDDGFSTAVSIKKIDQQYQISPDWKDRSIKNTYNVPVMHGGHFYAYSTRIMTCVDGSTGEAKWKSRKPGDGFLVVVDGHVILNTKRGGLYVLRATPDGYEEIAGAKIFEDLVWSVPAFSQDAVFMRSLGELACVDIVGGDTQVVAKKDREIGKEFGNLVSVASKSADPQQVVDEYLKRKDVDAFPLIEGNLVHFVYQGDARDVAVAGDMFGARQERKMERIPGTDTWYHVIELPDDVRLNYVFLVDFQPKTDPRNKRTATSSIYAGEMEFAVRLRNEAPLKMSWFGMPNWEQPDFTAAVKDLSGELVKKTVASKLMEQPHEIEVYVPPKSPETGGESDAERYPVVFVFDGASAKSQGRLHEIMDNLCQSESKTPKAILVFIQGAPGASYLESIATEVVPFVDKQFKTIPDRTARICMSNGLMAPMSLQLVAKYPDVFGAASVQTPLIFDMDQQRSIDEIKEITRPTRIFFEWGRFDMFNPDENWDARKIGKRLFDEFSKSENVVIVGGEAPDSTDWSSWRNRFDQVLNLYVPDR